MSFMTAVMAKRWITGIDVGISALWDLVLTTGGRRMTGAGDVAGCVEKCRQAPRRSARQAGADLAKRRTLVQCGLPGHAGHHDKVSFGGRTKRA